MRQMFLPALVLIGAVCLPTFAQAQSEAVEYYHTDVVGTVRLITNANGQVKESFDYLPFGEAWPGELTSSNPRRFAGKERDIETGLNYFGARYYAVGLGRFTTVDPYSVTQAGEDEEVLSFLANPQRWNRYTYGLNNPLSFVDSDGKLPVALPIIYTATAYLAVSPAGQRAIIAGSSLLSRYGSQLQSFAWAVGSRISSDIFSRVGPVLTGRLAETLRGAPEAFRYTRGIDNFTNGTATSIKALDIFAKTYQNVDRLASTLTRYVQQLAGYQGGQTPAGFLEPSHIQKRVLEILLPGGRLTAQQLEVLGRIQEQARRAGVDLIYIQTQ